MSDEMGCLDSFCYLKGKAKGMHTNGGCRCVRNLVGRDNPAAAFALEKRLSELHNIIESLHTQLAASEARAAELKKHLEVGAKWLQFSLDEDLCDCTDGHICGRTERQRELDAMNRALASTGGGEDDK